MFLYTSGTQKRLPGLRPVPLAAPFGCSSSNFMSSVDSIPSEQRRRKRGGRPSLRDAVRLDARVHAACTVEQANQIRASARRCGMKTSQFLLDAALGVRVQAPIVPVEWRQVWSDLAPLSSNLHVLVRHLNFKAAAGEVEDAGTYDQLLRLVPGLALRLSQLRQALIPTQ